MENIIHIYIVLPNGFYGIINIIFLFAVDFNQIYSTVPKKAVQFGLFIMQINRKCRVHIKFAHLRGNIDEKKNRDRAERKRAREE